MTFPVYIVVYVGVGDDPGAVVGVVPTESQAVKAARQYADYLASEAKELDRQQMPEWRFQELLLDPPDYWRPAAWISLIEIFRIDGVEFGELRAEKVEWVDHVSL